MSDYSKIIWDYFTDKIGNEYGVAGLMGNLQAESGLCPYRLQGDFSSGYATSQAYTLDVDSGAISEYDFVNNGPNGGGYGLAQWTYSTRKQALYNMCKSGGYSSIGSVELACDYLWWELQNSYPDVLTVLEAARNVRIASDKVLHDFENPAVQTEAVEIARAEMGQNWFDLYTGTTPGGGTDPAKKKGLPLIMMYTATRRRF